MEKFNGGHVTFLSRVFTLWRQKEKREDLNEINECILFCGGKKMYEKFDFAILIIIISIFLWIHSNGIELFNEIWSNIFFSKLRYGLFSYVV